DLFTSKYWAKHQDQMKELWNKVPENEREAFNFDELKKKMLEHAGEKAAVSEKKRQILGLRHDGQYLELLLRQNQGSKVLNLRKKLQEIGEDFTKDDFFAENAVDSSLPMILSGSRREMPVHGIKEIMDIMADIGAYVSVHDLTKINRHMS